MKRAFAHLRLVCACAVVVGVGVTVLLVSGAGARSTLASDRGSITPSILKMASLPGGQKPTALAVAPDGSAWFWSNEASGQTELFRWDPSTDSLDSYDLGGTQTLGLTTGVLSGIAVAPNGTIWIGANRVLVSFNPQSEAVNSVQVPPLPIAGSLSALPSQYQGAQSIEAISASPAGTLAIAVTNGSGVPVLNTTSGQFRVIGLPQSVAATDVVYLANGALAVSVTSFAQATPIDSVMLVSSTNQMVSVPNIRGFGLTPDGTEVISNTTEEVINQSGNVAPLKLAALSAASTEQAQSTMAPASKRGLSAVAITKGSYTTWISRSGILISNQTTYYELSLPSTTCSGPMLVRPTGASDVAPSKSCTQTALIVGAGTSVAGVYIVPALSNAIYFLPTSNL